MEICVVEDNVLKNAIHFLALLNNPHWASTAIEKDIDGLFEEALKLEEISHQDNFLEKDCLLKSYPDVNFKKSVQLLVENIIKNPFLNEHITLYALKKYTLLYPKSHFSELLDKILSEAELRTYLFKLIEDFSDPNGDFLVLNNLLCDINGSELKVKLQSALKFQTSVLLKAIKFGEYFNSQLLIDEMIHCLESQTDLRLWFMIMKDQNLESVLDLCALYNNFLLGIFRFFDKFANEIESIYDEELNIQYSHVNLDFDDFVKIIQAFLNDPRTRKETLEYIDSKTASDKNFCFWIDVKTCL